MESGIFRKFIVNSIAASVCFVGMSAAAADRAFIWDSTRGMTVLGTLPGQSNSYGLAINNKGEVAGLGQSGTAFYWNPASGMQGINGLNDVTALSDRGLVVGNLTPRANCCVYYGAVWDSTSGLRAVGSFEGPNAGTSTLYDVNSSNQIAGAASGFSYGSNVAVWDQSNNFTDFGGRGGLARGINDSGTIVGSVKFGGTSVSSFYNQAFVGDAANGLKNIGDLTGYLYGSDAWAINNLGQVAVTAGNRAYLWDPANGMQNLGFTAQAILGINDSGQMIGRDSTCFVDQCWATFIWDATNGYRSIDSYLGISTGVSNIHVYGINNSGQLVGTATVVPLPSAVWLLASGLISLVTLVAKRNSVA